MQTTVTEYDGYRQFYTDHEGDGIGMPGFHRRIVRLSDDIAMYDGPGPDPDHPSEPHADWHAMDKEQRALIRRVLNAEDELHGLAEYLADRRGREAELEARQDAQETDLEVDRQREKAERNEYHFVLQQGLEFARDRLRRTMREPRPTAAAAATSIHPQC